MQSLQLRCVWKLVLSWSLILVLWLSVFDFVQVDVRAQGSTPETSEETALRAVCRVAHKLTIICA
jgi:hypothetical protein